MPGQFFSRIAEGFKGNCASLNKYGEPCGCKAIRIAKSSGKPRCRFYGLSGKQRLSKNKAARQRSLSNLTGPTTTKGRKKANLNLELGRKRQKSAKRLYVEAF